jgi:hypothetical protein
MVRSEYEQHVLAEMERSARPPGWHPPHKRMAAVALGKFARRVPHRGAARAFATGLAATDAAGTATAVWGFAPTVTAANIAVSAARRRRSATSRLGRLASRVLRLAPALRRYGAGPNHH